MTLDLTTLTLAEALVERKALKQRLDNLRGRLATNARVQEGDTPAEAPAELLADAERSATQMERLIAAINRTNVVTPLPGDDNVTLMEAIARRDMLAVRQSILEATIGAAATTRDRWTVTRNEVRTEATVDVASMQRQVDALAKTRRKLDTRLQAANWSTKLLE
jgi:hypothetical protein